MSAVLRSELLKLRYGRSGLAQEIEDVIAPKSGVLAQLKTERAP